MPDSHSLLWTVAVEMWLLLELWEAFIWAAISEAGNSNELILCSRSNSGSSFLMSVLMRASFIIVLATAFERTFTFLDIFCIDWPSSLKVMKDCHFSAYLSCSCCNTDIVFYQIRLSSVYHPYLVKTQLIDSNTLRKEILQINLTRHTW